MNSIKRRDKLLNSYINAKDVNRKEELHLQYKCLRNRIVALIRLSKKYYYQNYFSNNTKNIKKTWSGIKSLINIRAINKEHPNSILINNNLENEPTKMADCFNSYFTTVAEKLQQNIYFENTNFANYLKTPVVQNFLFESVDMGEINVIIDSLENNKATGPHSIPTEILKLVKFNLCYPLKEIINISFATGIYTLIV